MKIIHALSSGIVGAVSLTVLHQLLKKVSPDAPHIDELGMKAISASMEKLGIPQPNRKNLFKSSIAGDLVFNSIYYSFTAAGKIPLLSGTALGLGAGLGTVSIPGPLGLGKEYSARNNTTKALSVAIYLFGGWAAATTYKYLSKHDTDL